MIKAEHSNIARLIFNPYINRIIKKSFSNFYLVNLYPSVSSESSLIVTPNHISWWDGFFIDFVNRKKINRKMYLMMLESSLKKYWFFKKVGAYSIDPDNPRSIVETVKYTNEILNDTKNFVVTYPQGKIEPFEKRPIDIKEGLKLLIKNSSDKKFVLPVGFKIQFYNEKNPAVICRFGELIEVKLILEDYNQFRFKFTENIDLLNEAANQKSFIEDLLA